MHYTFTGCSRTFCKNALSCALLMPPVLMRVLFTLYFILFAPSEFKNFFRWIMQLEPRLHKLIIFSLEYASPRSLTHHIAFLPSIRVIRNLRNNFASTRSNIGRDIGPPIVQDLPRRANYPVRQLSLLVTPRLLPCLLLICLVQVYTTTPSPSASTSAGPSALPVSHDLSSQSLMKELSLLQSKGRSAAK